MPSSDNIFIRFLRCLNVKHTRLFAERLYNEHPHKYNMYGLSDMLSQYGIKSEGYRIEHKEAAIDISTPYISFVGSDFAVVESINKDNTRFFWKEKTINVPTNDYLRIWSGVVLIAKPSEKSTEPDYKNHKLKEIFTVTLKLAAFVCLGFVFLLAFVSNGIRAISSWEAILLFLNLAGAFIGIILVQKHLHINGRYVDKICSLFKQADCNNVLESDASMLFGLISWSEIGLSYFISNILIILLFPQLLIWMAIVNLCALPYTLWSVWYQGAISKQWCPLCLSTQILLWSLFATALIGDLIVFPSLSTSQIATTFCVYALPFFAIHFCVLLIDKEHRIVLVTQEINSIKANEAVFTTLLKQQPYAKISVCNSAILLGQSEADICLTVLTNPHCNPCAKMHKRIDTLLKHKVKVQVQYIFSSFSTQLEVSARYLIAVYQQKSEEERVGIYNEWYQRGKLNRELFFNTYPVNMDNPAIDIEMLKHKEWMANSRFHATPTLLVNGYKLPPNYKIDDLQLLADTEFGAR